MVGLTGDLDGVAHWAPGESAESYFGVSWESREQNRLNELPWDVSGVQKMRKEYFRTRENEN